MKISRSSSCLVIVNIHPQIRLYLSDHVHVDILPIFILRFCALVFCLGMNLRLAKYFKFTKLNFMGQVAFKRLLGKRVQKNGETVKFSLMFLFAWLLIWSKRRFLTLYCFLLKASKRSKCFFTYQIAGFNDQVINVVFLAIMIAVSQSKIFVNFGELWWISNRSFLILTDILK